MPYNDIVSRTMAAPLIPIAEQKQILQDLNDNSWLFSAALRLPNMSSKQTKMPVLSSLPIAYFVNGDTALKQTTSISWAQKYITAEEIAVIVPISEAVLSDSEYDMWGEVRGLIPGAFNQIITEAVLYGTNIPATWTTDMGAAGMVAFCTDKGHVASCADFTDFYEAAEGESAAGAQDSMLGLIEKDGFQPTSCVAHTSVKSRMRSCRDATGQKIYPNSTAVDGVPITYPTDGTMDDDKALMFAGDWKKLAYSIRQDMTFKILTEGALQDTSGAIVLNLAQQDSIALRCVMRIGWALPNPIIRENETEATRSPFSILTK